MRYDVLMDKIRHAFKVAFKEDVIETYTHWEQHSESIRIQSYIAATLALAVGAVISLMGLWGAAFFYVLAGYQFLGFHFCNTPYLIASRLSVEKVNDEDETRYEYLERVVHETPLKYRTTPQFMVYPYIAYALIVLGVIVVIIHHFL